MLRRAVPLARSLIPLLLLLVVVGTASAQLLPLHGRPYQALPHRALYARQLPEPFALTGSLYQGGAGLQYYDGAQFASYPYAVQPLTAVAQVKGEGVEGTLTLLQPHPPSGPVFISGNVTGLSAGKHGLHVHSWGDLRDGCKSTGDHYNPYQTNHGGPVDPFRHVGDLGNVEVGEGGVATLQLSDHVVSLSGPQAVVGRSLVITEKEDDLGRGGDQESLRTGNSGKPVACGIIGLTAPAPPPPPPPQPAAPGQPFPPQQEPASE